MRIQVYLLAALGLFGASQTSAQNVENGQRLAVQWCSPCHAVSAVQNNADMDRGRADHTRSFESIANMENVNFDKIVEFLKLPHAVMPNLPLSQKDIEDIAAYIAQMKK
jgi:mono/diheme cytochrome c family protein